MAGKPLCEIKFNDISALRLHVYVVGYAEQGESIVAVVAEGGKALYTIVTDCYETKDNYNHVMQILHDDWKSAAVDMFVWTHPHEDHSVGISRLLDAHDKMGKACVLGPINVAGVSGCKEIRAVATDAYNYLQEKYNSLQRYKYHFVGYDPEGGEKVFRVKFIDRTETTDPFFLELTVLAPYAALAGRFMNSPSTRDLNEISIAYMLTVCGLNLLMSGDMPDASIRKIENDWFRHVDYVKIPHHTSHGAGLLADKLVMNTQPEPEGVTTIFRVNGNDLPHMPTVEKYKKRLKNLYSTGPAKAGSAVAAYGCVHSVYDLSLAGLENVNYEANAYKF